MGGSILEIIWMSRVRDAMFGFAAGCWLLAAFKVVVVLSTLGSVGSHSFSVSIRNGER